MAGRVSSHQSLAHFLKQRHILFSLPVSWRVICLHWLSLGFSFRDEQHVPGALTNISTYFRLNQLRHIFKSTSLYIVVIGILDGFGSNSSV